MRRFLVIGSALAAALAWSSSAEAQPAAASAAGKEEAAAAYDRGAAAYDKGDFARAATELARADDLAPNSVTLELALDAAVRADDAVLAMTLAERADSRTMTKALDQASHLARRRFASKVGRVSVVCPPPTPCTATLDDAAFAAGTVQFVLVGTHRLRVVRESAVETFTLVTEPGKTVEVVPTAQRDRLIVTTPEPASERGLSPGWFFVGVGVTAALGAASIASGLDTLRAHRVYTADKSDLAAAESGHDAMVRTNVLLVATGVTALATAAIGVFAVRWAGGRSSVTTTGQAVLLRHDF